MIIIISLFKRMTYLVKHTNLTYGPQSNISKFKIYICVQIYKHKSGLGDQKNMKKLKSYELLLQRNV